MLLGIVSSCALGADGLNAFARIDHAAGAAKTGNPQGGTPFIECSQTLGIDRPSRSSRKRSPDPWAKP